MGTSLKNSIKVISQEYHINIQMKSLNPQGNISFCIWIVFNSIWSVPLTTAADYNIDVVRALHTSHTQLARIEELSINRLQQGRSAFTHMGLINTSIKLFSNWLLFSRASLWCSPSQRRANRSSRPREGIAVTPSPDQWQSSYRQGRGWQRDRERHRWPVSIKCIIMRLIFQTSSWCSRDQRALRSKNTAAEMPLGAQRHKYLWSECYMTRENRE